MLFASCVVSQRHLLLLVSLAASSPALSETQSLGFSGVPMEAATILFLAALARCRLCLIIILLSAEGRAVVKSTFVESKTSPSPGLSSPSQDRVQRGSSPSQVRVQRGSSPSQVQVQMRRSKQRKKKIIFF